MTHNRLVFNFEPQRTQRTQRTLTRPGMKDASFVSDGYGFRAIGGVQFAQNIADMKLCRALGAGEDAADLLAVQALDEKV